MPVLTEIRPGSMSHPEAVNILDRVTPRSARRVESELRQQSIRELAHDLLQHDALYVAHDNGYWAGWSSLKSVNPLHEQKKKSLFAYSKGRKDPEIQSTYIRARDQARFESLFEITDTKYSHRVSSEVFFSRVKQALPDPRDRTQARLAQFINSIVFPKDREGKLRLPERTLTDITERLRAAYLSRSDTDQQTEEMFQGVVNRVFNLKPSRQDGKRTGKAVILDYNPKFHYGPPETLLENWRKEQEGFPFEPGTTDLPYWAWVDKLAMPLVRSGLLGDAATKTAFINTAEGVRFMKGLTHEFRDAPRQDTILSPARVLWGISKQTNYWIHADGGNGKLRPEVVTRDRKIARALLIVIPKIFPSRTLERNQQRMKDQGLSVPKLSEKLLRAVATDENLTRMHESTQAAKAEKRLNRTQTIMVTGEAAALALTPDPDAPRIHIREGISLVVSKADLKANLDFVEVQLGGITCHIPTDGLVEGKAVKKSVERKKKATAKKEAPKKKAPAKRKK